MRRAKIVCTLGPAADSYDQIKALVTAGMDIARLNLTHGSQLEHEERYRRVRKASDEAGRSVGVLVDLQGPKIRLGTFADGPVLLERGDEFTITVEDVRGDREMCGTTYPGLADDVGPGERILVDDGRVALEVTRIDGPRIRCTVLEGGLVSDHKGLNLPGVRVSVPALSDKDVADLRWALRTGADLVALSFVRSGRDADEVHRIMAEEGRRVPVIAKLEKPQAVENLEAVIDAFDGIMIARGDLGVELPLEQVPLVQKRAIKLAKRNAKPVIVATQMLDSMIHASRPTRAEASDVANAVLDGTDAVMLSGETAVGKYPVETVRTMSRIIEAAEEDILAAGLPPLTENNKPRTQGGAVARAAAEIATSSTPSTSSPSPRAATPPAASPATARHPRPRLHLRTRRPQPTRPHLGRRDLPRPLRPHHRRDGRPGRRRPAQPRPLPTRRHRRHHRRLPARPRRLHQPGPRPPRRRTQQLTRPEGEFAHVFTKARRVRPGTVTDRCGPTAPGYLPADGAPHLTTPQGGAAGRETPPP